MSTEIDHEYTKEIVCPHCGHVFTDSWDCGPIDGHHHDVDCPECEKEFEYSGEAEVVYCSRKKEQNQD